MSNTFEALFAAFLVFALCLGTAQAVFYAIQLGAYLWNTI
jgi:hypothetical protein